jgi:hypothetical protein
MSWRQKHIVIGGVGGTVAEHVGLMKREGHPDRCIGYFIGLALCRPPAPYALTVDEYEKQPWSTPVQRRSDVRDDPRI